MDPKETLKAMGVCAVALFIGLLLFGDRGFGELVGVMMLIGVSLAGYFLPAGIAFGRVHQHSVPILLLNLFFGWTLISWVAALVWSAMPVTRPATN